MRGGRRLELDWDGARAVAVRSSCGRVARYHYNDAATSSAASGSWGPADEVDDRGRIVEVWTPMASGCAGTATTTRVG
jgi:hypothetical protein